MNELSGYRAYSYNLLRRFGVSIGDLIRVKTVKGDYEGVLMPRYEFADDKHIVIKLKNGYNIGVRVERIESVERLAAGEKPAFIPPPPVRVNPSLPKVSIISTGGTIASRVDYRTGGVYPALSAADLYAVVPELSSYAQVDAEVLMSVYSENITPRDWSKMAMKVSEKIGQGFQGVVVTHGTDTMHYSSAALSFALSGVPAPVLLVGSQRSSDRPSSDAALNLMGAVSLAVEAGFSGVYVVMHAGMSDDVLAVHLGTRVRKNHTSRRDAFESVDTSPVAYVKGGRVEQVSTELPRRGRIEGFHPKPNFDEKVALVKFYPGFDPSIISHLVELGYHGIILEGTGLGHVSSRCYEYLERARDAGILIGMTSQCIWGRVRMTVYETGRDLLSIGVIPLEDMIPEVAYVKMSWALGNSKDLEEAVELMKRNVAGEYLARSPIERRPKG